MTKIPSTSHLLFYAPKLPPFTNPIQNQNQNLFFSNDIHHIKEFISCISLVTYSLTHRFIQIYSSATMTAFAIKSAVLGGRSLNLTDTHFKSTRFRKPLFGFRDNVDPKWVNLCLQGVSLKNRGAVVEGGKRRGWGVVRCTAEGIERGLLGRRGQEGNFAIPERLKVVALMAAVMCLCNADRVVMSVAIVPLAAKHGWSSSFLGIVQSSFLWGYIFSSVVGGALVDKYGGKRVIAWGVFLWSLATLITPWAANHSTLALLAVRAFFGLAEGVAMPSMNIILSRWFPCNERATAVGLSMGGFHLGNVVGLILTPIMMSSIGLSGPFFLFASLGLLWLTTWTVRVTNDPQDSSSISSSELRLIQEGKSNAPPPEKGELPPLRLLLSKMPTWAIIFANITNNWGYFVLLSWMPVYFKTVFNVNLKQAAWFSALPWGTMAFSGYVAGAASDYLLKAGHSLTFVRKVMQSIGFIGPGLALLCLNYAKSPVIASVFLTVALSLSSFSQAGFLLNMQDIAPQHAGFLHGISNSAGTLAAIISTIGTGYFVQWLGSFQAFLTVTAGLYFVTAIFWNLFATGERVF